MFETLMVNEAEVKKTIKRIIKTLGGNGSQLVQETNVFVEIKIKEWPRKKARNVRYKDVLRKKCKEHRGPSTNMKELKHLVKDTQG